MSGSAAKRPRPRKPYYGLTELGEAWSLTASDIESYVLAQELSGIVVEHDRCRDRSASAYCRGQRVLQASVLSGARPRHILL